MAESEHQLYLHHEKIYPREVHGKFAFFRLTGVVGLLGLYYVIPWLNWDGRQAVLFDLPGRKFFIFNFVIWPQELYFLAALLVILGIALFLFTAVAGRLWCGYA
ncbi:MAG: cytochrome c oxidase accessory protein CcoG, partial [Gammaproteobacteria bacterium]|nr:cytochrome c oxidase accessory protein CcoG [Gammaproteobacteria bacterium]